jgi:hypothetical protein
LFIGLIYIVILLFIIWSSLIMAYNLFIVAIIYCNPPSRVGFVATLAPKL